MQAVIALCYFCENHGPRVVLVCQPMRNRLRERAENSSSDDTAMDVEEEIPRFYGDIGSQEDVLDEEPRCAACSSFGSGLGILSNDHEAETSYVSTQAAINERVNNMVKQACLRSLSVEISTPLYVDTGAASCSGFSNETFHKASCGGGSTADLNKGLFDKDGVVLFGDDKDGYVLSHTFRLKDAKARGFNRSYSMIVVSRDKLMLLTNYEFFLGGFFAMISNLQSMAANYCVMEQKLDVDLRIVAQSTNNRAPYLPAQFYPRNVTLDTSRSLTQITNNKNIFTLLHRQMLYLLKTQTMLEQDTVLEGVPTQDMLVMMEMERSSMEENDLLTALSAQQSSVHFLNLKTIVAKLHALRVDYLTELIWQVIVGGQIVVKSDVPCARRLFLLALVNLLPVGCVKIASNATSYIHAYKHNFLGCALDVEVPEEVRGEVFEIELRPSSGNLLLTNGAGNGAMNAGEDPCFASSPCSSSATSVNSNEDAAASNSRQHRHLLLSNRISSKKRRRKKGEMPEVVGELEDLGYFEFCVKNVPSRSGARPLILTRYLQLLLHPMLNVCTLESALRATRNDWLNHAKLIFQLRHQKEGIDISKIIRIIKCGSEDSPVLLFWQSGLSRRYKQVVLNTINTTADSNSSTTAAASLLSPRPNGVDFSTHLQTAATNAILRDIPQATFPPTRPSTTDTNSTTST